MYSSILAATDGSELGANAVSHASRLAQAFGAKLTIVVVTEQMPVAFGFEATSYVSGSVFDDVQRTNRERSIAILDAAVKASGLPAHGVHLENMQPYRGILDAAKQSAADLIVMGSHGYRGVERLIMGSQAHKVLTLADAPVLVVKG